MNRPPCPSSGRPHIASRSDAPTHTAQVLDICHRCPKLRIIKSPHRSLNCTELGTCRSPGGDWHAARLFKNDIDDKGMEGIDPWLFTSPQLALWRRVRLRDPSQVSPQAHAQPTSTFGMPTANIEVGFANSRTRSDTLTLGGQGCWNEK